MKSRLTIAIATFLTAVAIALVVVVFQAFASTDSDKAEIVALNQRLADLFSKGDLDGAMAYYMDDKYSMFYEDDVFQLDGKKAFRKYIANFYRNASHINQGVEAISVVVSGDLAAAHYTIPMVWTDKSGTHSVRARYRYTQVLRKVGGKWLIWHEHLSVPYDPATGKAVLDARP